MALRAGQADSLASLERTSAASGTAHARAALLGNPSDGYGGKTIAVTVRDFAAEVVARPSRVSDGPALDLTRVALERFEAHSQAAGIPARRPGSLACRTEIPRQVGLGGSSAIVIATLRALAAFNGIEIGADRLAELALAAEVEGLGIAAGPQDRVAQAHGGLVYMDFDPAAARVHQRLDPGLLPPLFLAYGDASDSAGTVHAELRRQFERGDDALARAMEEIAGLAERGRACLLAGDHGAFGALMDANVDARARIVALEPGHARMVEIARAQGAHANYAGSGGAIVGVQPEDGVEALRAALAAEGGELIEGA
ncbi:MAG: mevalonate kinase family protein [Solirubrobacterales bacterium]